MTRAEKALALHGGGSSCSQAVFTVFAADMGMDEALAHKVSTGLGGGMGRMGLTCGAISGGVLALSLMFGSEVGPDQDAKMKTYGIVSKFIADFDARYGSTQCRALLGGADLWTEEGRAAVKAGDLGNKVCNTLIADVVNYVEALLPKGTSNG